MDEQTETRLQLRRDFLEFLDQDYGEGVYKTKIQKAVEDSAATETRPERDVRLVVDLQDLQNFNQDLHRRVTEDPAECIQPFEDALEEIIRNNHSKALSAAQRVHVAIGGEFGAYRLSPRQLLSCFINRLVQIYGIVTKVSVVRPKLSKSVHYCEATGQFKQQEYRDVTSSNGLPTGSSFPTADEVGNLYTTIFGSCEFVNHQTVVIQELPETAPPGQLPRSTEIVLEHDLVNTCKPGDRVEITGIYKALAGKVAGVVSGSFRSVVVANNVTHLSRDIGVDVDMATIEGFYEVSPADGSGNPLEHLAMSIAPSIYGHETVKKALVLLLLGGRERNLENGTHLRGDINCLLIGDPGVAKSQLLRAIMNIAPVAVSTTGRGSSGVGLTAAVTTNADTGEKQLEAGAMVLADRGIACIDEFDKMNDNDRVAVHEVMEQQTVTIAKAGIHTSLHARCSVLAAANPLYGTYDHSISITKNINLPDSLLSRFDLLFVMLDSMDERKDKKIAQHVVNQHLYRAPGDDGKTPINESTDYRVEQDKQSDKQAQAMYVKYDSRLYGPKAQGQPDPLSVNFLKKFFHFAKYRFNNVNLTTEANQAIAEYYTELRSTSGNNVLPVTVRTLETIIRLSCAHAKCRLSGTVEVRDVEVAKEILDEVMDQSKSKDDEGWNRGKNGRAVPTVTVGTKRDREAEEGAVEGQQQQQQQDAADDPMEEEQPEEPLDESGPMDDEMPENDENQPPVSVPVAANKPSMLGAIKMEVKAMLQDRGASMSFKLADLQKRLTAKGVQVATEALNEALLFMHLETDSGRSDVPIFYDTDTQTFLDCS